MDASRSDVSLGADLEAEDEDFNDNHVADPGSQHFDEGGSARGLDLDDLCSIAETEDIKLSLQFVTQLQSASLEDVRTRLNPETLNRLRHPPEEEIDITDPNLRLA